MLFMSSSLFIVLCILCTLLPSKIRYPSTTKISNIYVYIYLRTFCSNHIFVNVLNFRLRTDRECVHICFTWHILCAICVSHFWILEISSLYILHPCTYSVYRKDTSVFTMKLQGKTINIRDTPCNTYNTSNSTTAA